MDNIKTPNPIVPLNSPPIVDSNSIIVDENSTDTSLGLIAPTDIDGDPLNISAFILPVLGTITKDDGTLVNFGDTLTSTELVGLEYDAPTNYDGIADPGFFAYFVNDGTFNILGSTIITINPLPKDFKPNEVIVKLNGDINSLPELNFEIISTIEGFQDSNFVHLRLIDQTVESFIEDYSDNPLFGSMTPNYTNFTLFHGGLPDDTDFNKQWALHNIGQTGGTIDVDINVLKAWDYTTSPESIHHNTGLGNPSRRIRVAVIDTGLNSHPDLNGNIDWSSAKNFTTGGGSGQNSVTDHNGHGTQVAGIIGALNNTTGIIGINPKVEIIPIKAFDSIDGGDISSDTFTIMKAIQYANGTDIDPPVDIINASWGHKPNNGAMSASFDTDTFWNSIIENGPLFVTAAGNGDGTNANIGIDIDDPSNAPIYPAKATANNIISVASTDHNDNLSPFSNWGAKSVDLSAPGGSNDSSFVTPNNEDIYTTTIGNGYGYIGGTSAAAAHVSGAAAFMAGVRRRRQEFHEDRGNTTWADNLHDLSPTELKDKVLLAVKTNTPNVPNTTFTDGRLNFHTGVGLKSIGWGDVHFVTFDQKRYDMQSFGDFIMARTGRKDDDWEVQTRQQPYGSNRSVAVNKAFATLIDGKKVVFDQNFPNHRLQVDGVDFPLASGQTKNIGNSQIERNIHKYTITYAGNNDTIDFDDAKLIAIDRSGRNGYININISSFGTMEGLLGNNDGDSTNDFVLRDGTQLPNNLNSTQIHQEFADNWRVKDEESLFEDSAKVIGLPDRYVSLNNFTVDEIQEIEEKLRAKGITDPDIIKNATLDVLITGDDEFIDGATELSNFLDEEHNDDHDDEPPVVVTLTPTDNATNVAIADNLVIDFNEDVQANTGNIIIKKFDTNLIVESIDVNSNLVTISNNTVTIDPTSDLLTGTKYYVEIGANAIKDTSGNNYLGITNNNTWDFTTEADNILTDPINNNDVIHPNFNGDRVPDIFWRDGARNRIWLMNNDGTRHSVTYPGGQNPNWDIGGIGDFNGDSISDIFWRQRNGSGNRIWLMNNNGRRDNITYPGGHDSNWDIEEVKDLNGDSISDIFWRQNNGSGNKIWLMDGLGSGASYTDVFPGYMGSNWEYS